MFVHWAFFLFRLYIKWNYIVFVILDISLSIIPLRSIQFSSVQFSRSVLSEYLQTHEHQHLLLPSIFPSIRDFSKESALCIRGPKYWSFSFISPSSEHPGLTSFRMDWLDLHGTLKSPPTPQFKAINSSALSFLYSPTLTSIHDHWKNHSLD